MDAYSRRTTTGLVRRRPDSLDKIKKSARKLFVERGYHATRPQDITRDAGLGHGTFYLHYEDKRACYLDYVCEARAEIYAFVRMRVAGHETIEEVIAKTLQAVYEYSDAHPGVLNAAMSDEALIDVGGCQASSLIHRWECDWAQAIRNGMREATVADLYDPEILGRAIVGAIHRALLESDRLGVPREEVINNLSCFLARGLRP